MSVTPASSNAASSIQMDYMKLLVTQLRNQDPMEPMDNYQMAAQLTQFSQLEQLESMNKNFSQVLDSMQKNYAGSLIGKEVTFIPKDSATGQTLSGQVQEIRSQSDGEVLLAVGAYQVSLSDILSVKNSALNPQTKI